MRKLIISCIAWCLYYGATAQGITFEHGNFAAVCAKAKAEKKLVFIDVYTSWCGPCKHMAATVFKQNNVGQYFNSQFINYKIDAEKGEGKALAAKYKIQYYPTYLFIDDKGAVFNKAVGNCKDSVFLGIAAKAREEFTNPNSLPRMQAQYATRKKDTAFLRRYITKLMTNNMHAFEEIEQYLFVQTAMQPGSPEMMAFLIQYPRELYYGSRAGQVLEKYSESFRKVADSVQREQLEFANNMLLSNTRIYAFYAKSETVVKRYIHETESRSSSRKSFYLREATWLDFYSTTGNRSRFGWLANQWLDSICAQLKPVDQGTTGKNITPEQKEQASVMRLGGMIVCDNAKKYLEHFRDEKDVMQKVLRWVKTGLTVFPDYSFALAFYANLLYENNDTANAILIKTKALNSFPRGSLHRNIVQTNLEHMQKGEQLEEE
jgi:thiol-disulfide isomerase/thioredoxin